MCITLKRRRRKKRKEKGKERKKSQGVLRVLRRTLTPTSPLFLCSAAHHGNMEMNKQRYAYNGGPGREGWRKAAELRAPFRVRRYYSEKKATL